MQDEERDLALLETVLLLIERIKIRLAKTDLRRFVEDPDDIDLLAYRLSMIGEYAAKLSISLKDRHPEIPWKLMGGLRNIIAHEYMRVTPARIWQTATHDLDTLEAVCKEEVRKLQP